MNSEQMFNVGDEVVCIEPRLNLTRNNVYKITKLATDTRFCHVIDDNGRVEEYYSHRFEKKMTDYFPCKIAVNSPEESKLVQEWLFEQGCQWLVGAHTLYQDEPFLYVGTDKKLSYGESARVFNQISSPELKFTFKSVVDIVVLEEPKKKTIEIDGKTYDYDAVTERLKSLPTTE